MSALIKKENTEIATPIHSAPLEGFEDYTAEDISIPIITLLQSSSEMVKKGLAKLGDFQDSVSGMILGNKIEVIILRIRNGAIYFDRKKNPKSFVCRSINQINNLNGDLCAKCPHDANFNQWIDGQPPKCAASKEFLCVLASSVETGNPYPVWLSFKKTSYGIGKQLASKNHALCHRLGVPAYGHTWVISSKEEANSKGDFMNYVLEAGRQLNDQERATARNFWLMVKDLDMLQSPLIADPVEAIEVDSDIVQDV